jgi:hypothetical protein
MWSKRDFVKGATAVVTAGLVVPGRPEVSAGSTVASGSAAPAVLAVPPGSAVDVVVYNDWYPTAHAFAADFASRGARALPVQGDAGKLWYDSLRGLVAGGSRRIAGMTTHTDLFILETLARDHGLKVRHRNSDGGARLVSWVLT